MVNTPLAAAARPSIPAMWLISAAGGATRVMMGGAASGHDRQRQPVHADVDSCHRNSDLIGRAACRVAV
jgi:hypothetical protein